MKLILLIEEHMSRQKVIIMVVILVDHIEIKVFVIVLQIVLVIGLLNIMSVELVFLKVQLIFMKILKEL